MGKSSHDPGGSQRLRRDDGLQNHTGHDGGWFSAVCDFLFVNVLYENGVGEAAVCFFLMGFIAVRPPPPAPLFPYYVNLLPQGN